MDVVLWIVAGLLALAFLGAGFMKVSTSKPQLAEKGMTWVEDFSAGQVKGIGVLEILGALGVVLPAFVDATTFLVPTAATGLLLVMVGAVATHVRRHEQFVPALVLGVVAAFLAVGRFWIQPF